MLSRGIEPRSTREPATGDPLKMSVIPHLHAIKRVELIKGLLRRATKSPRFVFDHFAVEVLDKLSHILLISRPDDVSQWTDKIMIALSMVKWEQAPKSPEGEATSCLQLHLTERMHTLVNSLCGHFGEATARSLKKLSPKVVRDYVLRHMSFVCDGFFEREVAQRGGEGVDAFCASMKNARRLLNLGSVSEVRIPVPHGCTPVVEALAPRLSTTVHQFGFDQAYRFTYMTSKESLDEDVAYYKGITDDLCVVMDSTSLYVTRNGETPKISAAEALCCIAGVKDVTVGILWPKETRVYACAFVDGGK